MSDAAEKKYREFRHVQKSEMLRLKDETRLLVRSYCAYSVYSEVARDRRLAWSLSERDSGSSDSIHRRRVRRCSTGGSLLCLFSPGARQDSVWYCS